MFPVFGIIRMATAIGLAAVKVVSVCLQYKEARDEGSIRPISEVFNRNASRNNYNRQSTYNCYQQYNNNTELRWNDGLSNNYSRRNNNFSNINSRPNVIVQPVSNVSYGYGYADESVVNNNYQNNFDSRRWNNCSTYESQPNFQGVWSTNNNNFNYGMSTNMNGHDMYNAQQNIYQNNPYQQYQPNNMNIYGQQELRWKNEPLGAMTNMFNNRYGYNVAPMYNTNNTNVNNNNELKWRDDKFTYTQSRRYGIPQTNNTRTTTWKPSFDWQGWLKTPPDQYGRTGVVPMFYTDDGKPLFGPVPV